MSVIYIVVPLALLVVGAAVGAFVWATNRGQFDDLDTPAVRMLHDDEEHKPASDAHQWAGPTRGPRPP
ncbi:MAG: cbb3-type cytochrome oxidase assembly protein CcoS [Gemmatimonadaceae bacterium]